MLFFENFVSTGKYLQYIVERVDDQYGVASYPIATVYLKDVDKTNHRCELCIFTSDDEEWNDESKSIAIKMMLEEAFNDLNMNKVYSYVFIEYLDEADLLKNAGFKAEAILSEEAVDSRGNYSDVIRFSIKKSDYEKGI